VMPGILIGAAALAERGVLALRNAPRPVAVLPALAGVLGLAILVGSSSLRARIPSWPPTFPTREARLGPIRVEAHVAGFMQDVRKVVDHQLPAGEAVWAGPAAPGWNFLLDRAPAHPLPIAFVTTTYEDRERVRQRLIDDPPKLILRQRDRPTFEGVPMRALLGVAADHIDAHYEAVDVLQSGRYAVEVLVPR